MKEPYKYKSVADWEKITQDLIAEHPLSKDDVVKAVLAAWNDLFKSKIGPYQIGVDIFPKPQIVGFFLHELIPLKLKTKYPKMWDVDKAKNDKDIVCLKDSNYSIEIKTSSNPDKVFGNRSYGIASDNPSAARKSKSGYYLLVNFQPPAPGKKGKVLRIRFGWIDASDWRSQTLQTGQQASLPDDVYKKKMVELFNEN